MVSNIFFQMGQLVCRYVSVEVKNVRSQRTWVFTNHDKWVRKVGLVHPVKCS
jgi:hypothetical protein